MSIMLELSSSGAKKADQAVLIYEGLFLYAGSDEIKIKSKAPRSLTSIAVGNVTKGVNKGSGTAEGGAT